MRHLLSLAAAVLVPLFHASAAAPRPLDGVAAVVNNEIITFSQVNEMTAPLIRATRANLSGPALEAKLKEIHNSAVEELVNRQLIVQEFRKMKAQIPSHVIDDRMTVLIRDEFGGDRSAFIRTLAAQGMTIERLRKMEEEKIIVQAMRQREVKTDPIISNGEIQSYYNKNKREWTANDEVKLRMIKIVAAAEAEAKRKMIQEIRDKIVRGADFADLARIYSEDPTQDAGGDWGWVKRGDLSPQMEAVVFNLPKGKPSDVIAMNDTYYILLAEDRKDGTTKPLSEVRPEIERRLLQVARQKQMEGWIKRLRSKAYVKIY